MHTRTRTRTHREWECPPRWWLRALLQSPLQPSCLPHLLRPVQCLTATCTHTITLIITRTLTPTLTPTLTTSSPCLQPQAIQQPSVPLRPHLPIPTILCVLE